MREAQFTKITYRGYELEVEHTPYPAEIGGRESPSWDAGTEIEGVTEVDSAVDLMDLLDPPGHDFDWGILKDLIEEAAKDDY